MKDEKKSPKPQFLWLFGAAASLALGLWHFTDVRAGVLETGHTWLYGWYVGLMVFAAFGLAASGYVMFIRKKQTVEVSFAVTVFFLGLMYLAVLAPLSAPDEVSHFISAYQLSSRMLGQTANADDGRVYIRAEDAFIEDMQDVMADDGSGYREAPPEAGGLPSEGDTGTAEPASAEERPEAKILGQELTEETYRIIHDGTAEDGSGAAGSGRTGSSGSGQTGSVQEQAVSYQPPVRTTPLAYVPQALGIALARLAGFGSLGLLYMGRLFNLLFYTITGYFTIKRMPFGKEVMAGAALLPMSLHLAASFSYDVMILALSAHFTAVCLDLAYRAQRVRAGDILLLALIMGVMGPCKMVYGVIAGYCLLIPVKKFGNPIKWTVSAAAVLGAFGLAMVLVNRSTVTLYTQTEEVYITWAEEAGYTFSGLLHSPLHVLKMCYNTLAWEGEPLYSGMIGEALGNMDPVLNTPYVIVLALTAALLMLALRKPGETIYIKGGQRLWIWFLCLTCLGALMFSMLLAWTPVSSSVIRGVQGRYLLPLLPMFLLTLKNDRVVRTGWDDRGILYTMTVMDVYVILRIFAVVCLRIG